MGVITLEIQANPAPHLEWTVRGEKILEGRTDQSGRLQASNVKDLGGGIYEATLSIASITKQDTETQFTLSAYNTMGKQDYYVQISTEPEPEGNYFLFIYAGVIFFPVVGGVSFALITASIAHVSRFSKGLRKFLSQVVGKLPSKCHEKIYTVDRKLCSFSKKV